MTRRVHHDNTYQCFNHSVQALRYTQLQKLFCLVAKQASNLVLDIYFFALSRTKEF